jgi:iron complex outermembrane receptor protein
LRVREGALERTIRKPGDLPGERLQALEREVRMALRSVPVFLIAVLFAFSALAEDAPVRVEPAPEERVEVTAARLADPEERAEDVPALVTVVERDAIERSGARTLQDLLAVEAGIVLYDQVGNDVQKTFDLRGFATGTGTAVFLDGARLNDPKNNAVALEMVPLDAIERVEIVRGSAAAVAGAGSEAGIVHLRTRRGEGLSGSLRAGAGSDAASNFGGALAFGTGRFDGFVSAARDENDGFRENAGGTLDRYAGSFGVDLGGGRRLALTGSVSRLDWGAPGALTQAEWEADPTASPYNELDGAKEDSNLAVLQYTGPLSPSFSISANLFARGRDAESLSTGRAAASFGGFFLDADASDLGSTVQVTHDLSRGAVSNRLIAGVEWLGGTTDSLGFFTSPADPGTPDLASPNADNRAEREAAALFVQNVLEPSARWAVTLGARADRDRIRYEERLPDPTLSDERTYSEVSLRGGVTFEATERIGLWVGYGESFLPPTVEEAFAFPGFGSNRDLDPEDARSYEAGARFALGSGSIDAALFRIDTEDEIVFDPTPTPTDPFGRNVNAGETARTGVEIAARGRAHERVSWFVTAAWVDAEFRGGANDGNRVPLVPEHRVGAGVDLSFPAGLGLRLEALRVGPQVLDNDPGNTQSEMEAYSVANARFTWEPRLDSFREGGGPRLYAEVRNLTDETYATRGIRAFDFSTFEEATFYTPAPGRRWYAGLEWRF